MESAIRDFQASSSESRILMEKLFSFYVILGLHGPLRDVIQSINEKALHCDSSVVNGRVNDAFALIFCFGW